MKNVKNKGKFLTTNNIKSGNIVKNVFFWAVMFLIKEISTTCYQLCEFV